MSKENLKNKIELKMYDELFLTDEGREDLKRERVFDTPLEKLIEFKDHPFQVNRDEELLKIMESIKENGVLIRNLTDDEAVIALVDSNIQRENILPSEKAFAYKMKMEAMKRQAGRPKKNSCQVGTHLRTDNLISENAEESARTIQRYIRLTKLIPPLLEKVDMKQIAFTVAVELSYLTEKEQATLLNAMELSDCTPSLSQAQRMKKASTENNFQMEFIDHLISEQKANQKEQLKIPLDRIKKYFPKNYTTKQMEDTIEKLLMNFLRKRQAQERNER